jgi:hypothetical protein
MLSPDGRFEIVVEQRDREYTWSVRVVATGDELLELHGTYIEAEVDGWAGVHTVRFADGFLVVTQEGFDERIELPARAELAPSGDRLVLAYADGRVESRERRLKK